MCFFGRTSTAQHFESILTTTNHFSVLALYVLLKGEVKVAVAKSIFFLFTTSLNQAAILRVHFEFAL